jgi:hypothetical protein
MLSFVREREDVGRMGVEAGVYEGGEGGAKSE